MPVSLMCAYAADSQTKINTAWYGGPRPRKTKKMGQNPPAVNPESATMPKPPTAEKVAEVVTRPFWSAPRRPTPVPATVTIITLYWLARGQKRAVKELALVLVLRRLVVHLTWSPVLCLEYKRPISTVCFSTSMPSLSKASVARFASLIMILLNSLARGGIERQIIHCSIVQGNENACNTAFFIRSFLYQSVQYWQTARQKVNN